MKFLVILNRDGGTLRTTDLDAFADHVRETLGAAGHEVEIDAVAGSRIEKALKAAADRADLDVVMAGGGDGTISTAAGALAGSGRALAILPAGTMNLFARGLGIPQDIHAAVRAFADGVPHAVDIASANGRVFIHQFSIGMHAELIEKREGLEYGSRWGKITASARAAFQTLRNPPRLKVKLEIGGSEILANTSSIGVSNNVFDEGHLPYADMPDKGELGIYITRARRRSDVLRFVAHMALGRWKNNPIVEIHRTDRVRLTLASKRKRFQCSIDGELCPLDRVTDIEIRPGALKVLLPAPAA